MPRPPISTRIHSPVGHASAKRLLTNARTALEAIPTLELVERLTAFAMAGPDDSELMMTANQIKVAQLLLSKTLPDIPKLTAGQAGGSDANPELPGGRLVAWEEEPAVLATVPAEPPAAAPAPAPSPIFDEVPLYVVSKASRAGERDRVTPLDLASEAEPLELDSVRDGTRSHRSFDIAF